MIPLEITRNTLSISPSSDTHAVSCVPEKEGGGGVERRGCDAKYDTGARLQSSYEKQVGNNWPSEGLQSYIGICAVRGRVFLLLPCTVG